MVAPDSSRSACPCCFDALPKLPLDAGSTAERERAQAVATGTFDRSFVAPPVALTLDKPRQTACIVGQAGTDDRDTIEFASIALKGKSDKGSGMMTTTDKVLKGMETTGIEPATSWLQIVKCSRVNGRPWVVNPNVLRLYTRSPGFCNNTQNHSKPCFGVENHPIVSGKLAGFRGSNGVHRKKPWEWRVPISLYKPHWRVLGDRRSGIRLADNRQQGRR
jgi:hypothetical protein